MREISLHLMDIMENSIAAAAKLIILNIEENSINNYIKIVVEDNGCGVKEDMLESVKDPFTTTRKTRRIGMGLSLFEAACLRCGGKLMIASNIGFGTRVEAYMEYNHIDRAPLGRIEDTIVSILSSKIDIIYKHIFNENVFLFDSREIKKISGDNLTNPEILCWIRGYIKEGIENTGSTSF